MGFQLQLTVVVVEPSVEIMTTFSTNVKEAQVHYILWAVDMIFKITSSSNFIKVSSLKDKEARQVIAHNVASAYHHYHHFDDYFRHPHSEESEEYDSWEDSDEHFHHHPKTVPHPRQKVTQTLKTTSELLRKLSKTTKSITRSTIPQSTKPVVSDLPTRSFSVLKPLPRYEVHEAVDDIPNNEIFKPVVTNFNIKKPLNIAGGNQALNTGQNNPDDRPRRTYVSISANGDYVDDDKNINEHPNFAGLTEFWQRVKKTVGKAANKAVYSWNKNS